MSSKLETYYEMMIWDDVLQDDLLVAVTEDELEQRKEKGWALTGNSVQAISQIEAYFELAALEVDDLVDEEGEDLYE